MKLSKETVWLLKHWTWPRYKRHDGKMEYSCPHGIGHGGVHGCDGCCSHVSFPGARGGKKDQERIS